jgi:hypothetical protein
MAGFRENVRVSETVARFRIPAERNKERRKSGRPRGSEEGSVLMSKSSSVSLVLAGALALCAAAWPALAPAQPAGHAAAPQAKAVPDLSGLWVRRGQFPSTYEIPEEKPGPLVNTITGANAGLIWVADHTDPLLKPWVADYLKKRGEQEIIEVNNVAHNLCWPSGVPQVINLREPVQFLQTPNMVTILYQRDHMVRRVYLNEKHPANVKPSWYGHSIGHYEGDTLVIDTVGLNDKTGVDRFNTPHTTQMRVVERYRMIENGQALRVNITVEDPGAFNSIWHAQATYRRNQPVGLEEIVCAENNRDIHTGKDYPIPVAAKADF